MKTLIIITLIALVAFFVFQSFTMMSTRKTEEQKYSVILKDKDFEIRFYPSATIATINSEAKTYKDLSNPGFRQLAGYIFGGNETQTNISMTSPVHMSIGESGSSMSFVMPSGYNQENLPKPNNSSVRLETTSDEYVAAVRFSGFASDKDLQHYAEKLNNLLIEKNITALGNARYLGYNPPFQLLNRRNEIIVTIKWDKP